MKKLLTFSTVLVCLSSIGLAAQSDGLPRGAYQMPYIRYEADKGKLGPGAQIKGPSYDQAAIESEASERKYVELSRPGAYVEWAIQQKVDGITLRFTMPDSDQGDGLTGRLQLSINNTVVRTIELTSYYAWQYFSLGNSEPFNAPGDGRKPRMRFDEERFILPAKLNPGDVIKLQRMADDAIVYGIDFIEVEAIQPPLARPAGFLDVTASPFNAVPNDDTDDFPAFEKALTAAYSQKKGLYIPPGRFKLSRRMRLNQEGLRLLGAGIWHTELHFYTIGEDNAGIYSNASRNHVSDFYMTSVLNSRQNGSRAIGQDWGTGSRIENIWMTHFPAGLWIADYETPISFTEGLIVRNCRIRNMYADGCNFAKGSKNCILEHSHIRNTCDDAAATWSSDIQYPEVPPATHNTFRFITAENIMRAAGLGIFGGQRHVAHHCLIRDTFGGSGIRLNSTFEAHPFADDSFIRIFEMTVERCGTRYNIWGNKDGAVNLGILRFNVNNIKFSQLDVYDSQVDGLFIEDENINDSEKTIHDVYFDNIHIHNTGMDGLGEGFGLFALHYTYGWIQQTNSVIDGSVTGAIHEESPYFNIRTVNTAGNQPPIADAGKDIFESTIDSIQLKATSSRDPENAPLSYEWIQVDGEPVDIDNPASATPTVTGLKQGRKYIFRLTVSDGVLTDTAIVKIG
jgi:hypothetical protein